MTRSRDLADLGGNAATLEKQGLTLIKTESFSGVTTVNVNDVFSATYNNYLTLFDITTATAVSGLRLRMRVSGSDNTSSQYRYVSLTPTDNSATWVNSRSDGTATYIDDIGRIDDGFGASGYFNLFSPFATNLTRIVGSSSGSGAAGINNQRTFTGQLTVTTSYTGFTFIAASGNITGSYSVYGYNK